VPKRNPAIADEHLDAVLEHIRLARNFDFRNYKRPSVQRRIQRRMDDRQCSSYGDYLRVLREEPEEVDALIATMLLKVTSFFRDDELWVRLVQKVLPSLLAQERTQDELRIWSAGCATGEEAFSIAIALAEALGPAFHSYNVKIFGTDVDDGAIAHARRGVYSPEQVQNVSQERLARWFVRTPDGYAVRTEIRRVVVFGVNNLVSDAPISRLDLIFCRNVFIYLDAELQKRVLTRFHFALRREGVLVLGKSELIPFAAKIFSPEDLSLRIYRKDQRHDVPLAAQERLVGLLEQESVSRSLGHARDELSVLGNFYREILDSLDTGVFATGVDGSVTFWNQGAARLWGRTEGEVLGKKLSGLGLPGLSGDLLLEKTSAVRSGQSQYELSETLVAASPRAEPVPVTVRVQPVRDTNHELLGLLYVVDDVRQRREQELQLHRLRDEMEVIAEKLQTSNQELQSSNEELETTNEELQSANEELQTTNEELQSTNKELETTNEQLQSANAELDTINRELAHRTEELNTLALFQRTIIRTLAAAIMVVDGKGKITSWNLAAERLLGVTEAEAVGRPLATIRIPALERTTLAKLKRALSMGRPLRVEGVRYSLPTGGHGRANLSTIPLKEKDAPVGGLVVFEDITRALALVEENAKLRQRRSKRSRAKREGR
jgi:two-component system CheB/CheR fusion protein